MDLLNDNTIAQTVRVLWLAIVPLLVVPLVGFVVALGQGMLGAREESLSYAARAAAAVGVLIAFGAAISSGFRDLLLLALR